MRNFLLFIVVLASSLPCSALLYADDEFGKECDYEMLYDVASAFLHRCHSGINSSEAVIERELQFVSEDDVSSLRKVYSDRNTFLQVADGFIKEKGLGFSNFVSNCEAIFNRGEEYQRISVHILLKQMMNTSDN
jgi:hypothetical protein